MVPAPDLSNTNRLNTSFIKYPSFKLQTYNKGQLIGPALELGKSMADKPVTTVVAAQHHPAFRAAIQEAIDETNKDPTVCQNNNWKVRRIMTSTKRTRILVYLPEE
jgi:hypothetical protein